MTNTILRHQHQVEGEISLTRENGTVRFVCHWPFDLDTGEFIDFTNSFSTEAIDRMMTEFRVHGHGEAAAVRHGSLVVDSLIAEEFVLDASNSGQGEFARQIRLVLPASAWRSESSE